jgi:hypothetical protein
MFIVVGYYTKKTLYEKEALRLKTSLEKFGVPFYLQGIEDLGGWYANICFKPTFLKQMLIKFPEHDIIYVDCDAEFFHYPELFNNFIGNIGVYIFDRSEYGPYNKGLEVLSGTIFLRNNNEVKELIVKWEKECEAHPHTWDQKSLQKVLSNNYTELPGEYCKIFDRMEWIKNPVIVHYQASRKVRENGMKIK